MEINTPKIKKEMARVGITMEGLGKMLNPPLERRATWYLIHRAKSLPRIEALAEALGMDPKDLIV